MREDPEPGCCFRLICKIPLTPLELLSVQRDLYRLPLGPARFQAYLSLMREGDDITLPLTELNPMAKAHAGELVERLIQLEAEQVVEDVCAEVRARLPLSKADLQVGLVVVDDAAGGWTNRYLTDARERFKSVYNLKRGWVTVFIWTGESWDAAKIRLETSSAIYRSLYKLRYDLPQTLQQMMRQEGLAASFAGAELSLSKEALELSRSVIATHRNSQDYPITFACLYGDEGAAAAGYPTLGLPKLAGLELALAEVTEAPEGCL